MSKPKKSDSFVNSDSDDSDKSFEEQLKLLANKKSKSSSIRAKSDSDSSSDSDEEWSVKNGNLKRKKKHSNSNNNVTTSIHKKKTKQSVDSEPEEGEVSDSEEEEESDLEFDDGLDENLIRDEEDRKRLEMMSEKEREQELYNRIEKREALKTRFAIEKKLREAKKKDKSKSKQSNVPFKQLPNNNSNTNMSQNVFNLNNSSLKQLNVTQRSQDRKKIIEDNRKDSKKNNALNDLKAKREEKKKNAELKKDEEENENKKKLKLNDIYSDEEEEIETQNNDSNSNQQQKNRFSSSSSSSSSSSFGSDNEEDELDSQGRVLTQELKKKRLEMIENKDQLNKIRLSRFKLEKWCHYPFFSKTVVGCFVKIGIGNHEGRPIYRVAKIIEVVETGKVYQLGSTRTNKGLKLRYGKSDRIYRIEFVSNNDFNDCEFEKWRQTMVMEGCPIPTLYDVEIKLKDIDDALNFKCSDNDIEMIVSEKKKFMKNPHNYAMMKTDLLKQLDLAVAGGDKEEEKKLRLQLSDLEERAVELDKKRTYNISCISYINQRNRMRNLEDAVEASKREVAEMKAAKADPFTRRQCRPTLVTKSRDLELKVNSKDPQDLQDKLSSLVEESLGDWKEFGVGVWEFGDEPNGGDSRGPPTSKFIHFLKLFCLNLISGEKYRPHE